MRALRAGLASGVMAVTMVLAGAAPVRAQSSTGCTVTPALVGNPSDVCRKAQDLFAFVVPQFGIALAGGNTVLGEGGTLGGFGKRSVSLRITAVDGRAPKNAVPITTTSNGAVSNDFGATRVPVPMPSLDAAVGVFTGFPVGVTNVGGVDALVGLMFVPNVTQGDFSVRTTGSSVAFSYGVRVGLLQESSFVPGISLNWMRRTVPTLDLQYAPSNDSLTASNMALTADAFRAVISKRFTIFGLAAGVGRDEISGSGELRAVVNETLGRAVVTFPTLQENVKRNTAFVNASLGLSVARLVAEYGRASEGDERTTLNTFGDRKPHDAYTYGSLGVTIRF